MGDQDIALMAHLMRRAGFGATRAELEARVTQGYEATVEEMLNPDDKPVSDRNEMMRYHPWTWRPGTLPGMGAAEWLHDMVNTKRPLEEKMALFWHGLFATGVSKVDHYDDVMDMIVKFREKGMGDFRELLVDMAKDPAMIYWLDNCENHAGAVNENWGRELLELFSMGVGNYTEVDVRECSRAFTGWTIEPKLPRGPLGRHDWFFEYRPEDHDEEEKTFLGETGNLNGEDIVRIISEHPACAGFIARHLYNFFVADEAQVPAWSVTPPNDPEAVDLLANTLRENGYDMRTTLRVLFNSDFFKNARFAAAEEPHRGSGRHTADGWWRRIPGSRNWRPVPPAQLHGSGPAQPAQRGRLAYRSGVDQQWFADAPRKLYRRPGGRCLPPRHPRHGQPPAGQRSQHRRRTPWTAAWI